MKASAAGQYRIRHDADNVAFGVDVCQHFDCGIIVHAAINRYDDSAVANVEIHIACRHHFPVLFKTANRGHQRHFASERFSARAGIFKDSLVWIVGSCAAGNQNMVRANKARQIINMAVGMVVGEAVADKMGHSTATQELYKKN